MVVEVGVLEVEGPVRVRSGWYRGPPARKVSARSAFKLLNRVSTCSWRWFTCAAICLNSSESLRLLAQQFGAYRHCRLRWPHRPQGVSPLHLILRRLHSLQAMEMYRFRLLLCWGPDLGAFGESSSSSSTSPPGVFRFAPITEAGVGAPGVEADTDGVADDVTVSCRAAEGGCFFFVVFLSGLLMPWRGCVRCAVEGEAL